MIIIDTRIAKLLEVAPGGETDDWGEEISTDHNLYQVHDCDDDDNDCDDNDGDDCDDCDGDETMIIMIIRRRRSRATSSQRVGESVQLRRQDRGFCKIMPITDHDYQSDHDYPSDHDLDNH